VSRDGAITVPFAGRVHVAGMTPAQAESAIRGALAGKAMEPQVLVTVSNNISGTVTVMGEVTGGARIPLSLSGDRLLDVIATAGGIRTPVAETVVRLTRGTRTGKAALTTILANPSENVYVRPGDVITVERETRAFVALGASGLNAQVPFERADLTLAQAIGKAGGLQDQRADAAGVFLFRYETAETARALDPQNPLPEMGQAVPVVYRLDLRDPKGFFYAQRFAVHEDDVVYVSNSRIDGMQKGLGILSLVLTPILNGAALYNTTK
jgi:polysaccharide export outer membrane protein